MDTVSNLKEKLTLGAKGKAILFAGAGCTFDCLNFENKELPTANPLLEIFNKQLSKNVSRLDIAASMYLESNPSEYLNLLIQTFSVKRVPEDLVTILQYNWDRIYTTNYDNALEIAANLAGKQARPLIPADIPDFQPNENLQIIHLHGYIERFELDNVKNDCILDYNSNVANDVYEGHWANLLRNDISNADVVVFIGYSLYDPQIAKLIKSAEFTKEKIFFINSSKENLELDYIQKQYGTPKGIERDGFTKILTSAGKQAVKTPRKSFVCFDKGPELFHQSSKINQSDLANLFLFGEFKIEKAQADANLGNQNYIIRRDLIPKIVDRFDNGADFISIFAPLGHGKTIFAHSVAIALRESGNSVFTVTRNQMEFVPELLEIVEDYDNPIIIFDDFFRYAQHWDTLSRLTGEKVRVFATARINVFSSREDELIERFFDHNPESYRLDELSVEEGKSLVPLITQAGLWGESATLKDLQKLNILRSKAKSGFQSNFADILIGLMNSTDIVSRFKKELSILKEISPKCYEGVLISIYLEFTNNSPDVTLLQEGFGSDLKEFLTNPETGDLLKVFLVPDSKGMRYHSSVFSKHVLETTCDSDDVVKIVRKTVVKLATSTGISSDYKRLLVDLMRFNYLKSLCHDNNFDRTFNFYNELSALPQISGDDLFWNAFGMCERARLDFKAAREHFYRSISYAKNRGPYYKPYHAQNQLIVCILEAGFQDNLDATKAHADLLECIKLLMIQADDERAGGTGQAFSWYRQLGDFCDKYLPIFHENQKSYVYAQMLKYESFLKSKINNWENRIAVVRMVNEIGRLLSLLR